MYTVTRHARRKIEHATRESAGTGSCTRKKNCLRRSPRWCAALQLKNDVLSAWPASWLAVISVKAGRGAGRLVGRRVGPLTTRHPAYQQQVKSTVYVGGIVALSQARARGSQPSFRLVLRQESLFYECPTTKLKNPGIMLIRKTKGNATLLIAGQIVSPCPKL